MGLKDFLQTIFQAPQKTNLIRFYIRDKKCGDKMEILLRKSYDIQRNYEDNDQAFYWIKKVIICNKCYNKINLEIRFDKNYNVISQEIDNGDFISKEEFDAADSI